ncbi:MAG TPA: hypothetical protein VF624_00905 [Tepidisphaeraceae bacterium]
MATPIRWRLLLIAMTIYAALSAWMAVASEGFLEADGITHYLARRFALSQPLHIVGVWSRPVCVLLYCLPAYTGGLVATRLTSLVLVLLTALLTVDVARRAGFRRPEVAGLLLLTQPLLFAHSFSELTEVPFALMLLAMFAAYQRRWFGTMAIIAAVAPAARPEGFGVLAVAAVALLAHRRFAWLAVLPLGVVAWNYAGWRVFGATEWYPWWQWLRMNWPYSPQSVYGSGHAYYFLVILPAVVGPVAFPFVWAGAWQCLFRSPRDGAARSGGARGWLAAVLADHPFRCRVLMALVPLGVLIGHSLLWAMGRMASNGEPRYMLVAAPFWALLAALGWEWLRDWAPSLRPVRLAAAAAIVPLLANAAYPSFPLSGQVDDRLARAFVDRRNADTPEAAALRRKYPLIAASLPHVFLRLDIDRLDTTRVADPSQASVARVPRGVMMVWDDIYSTHNSNEAYCVSEQLLATHGWKPVHTIHDEGRRVVVYLSPLDIEGNPTGLPSAAD